MRTVAVVVVAAIACAACSTDPVAAPDQAAAPATAGGLPPPVDTTIHDVALDEILFDTFDGGSVALSEADATLIERLHDAIPPIDDPPYEGPEGGAWLESDDLVIGYETDAGDTYAYPHKILNLHEIVNDTLDGVPVLVSYCPLCRSGIVFDRALDGDVLSFGNTSALYENDLVMVDRQTGSYWWQVAGRAIVGARTGDALAVRPSSTTTWSEWLERHSDTRVLSRDLGFGRSYDRDPFVDYAERVNEGSTPFPVSPEALADRRLSPPASPEALADRRLSPAALVVGVEIGGDTVAFPIEDAPEGEIRGEVGGQEIVVRITAAGTSAGAFDAASGEPVPSRSTFWFAYVAAFPEARVVTSRDRGLRRRQTSPTSMPKFPSMRWTRLA